MAKLFLLSFLLIITLPTTILAQTGWQDITPIRNSGIQGLLGDIENHMPTQHIYRDADKVTHAHETQHGLSSRLRQRFGSKNAFYGFHNKAFLTGSSNVRLPVLASNIPSKLRGRNYQLYMIQQSQYWADDAAYIVEEYNCYVSGALVGREYKMMERTRDSFESACEFAYYSARLYHLTNNQELREFIKFMYRRTHAMYKVGLEEGWVSHRAIIWLNEAGQTLLLAN